MSARLSLVLLSSLVVLPLSLPAAAQFVQGFRTAGRTARDGFVVTL